MPHDLKAVASPAGGESESDPSIAKLLAALASMLHEATTRFEETSDLIAQLVVAGETGMGPELIVALQDFDRLRQDFVAIGSVLSRCSQATGELTPSEKIYPLHQVLADIPLVDFKKRLTQCLAWMSKATSAAGGKVVEEEEF